MSSARQIPRSSPSDNEQVDGGASWSAILLAALPHLLMAVLSGLSGIFMGRPPSGIALLGYGMLIAMVAAFLLAWRRGWPLWSGSWAGYWLMLPVFGSLLPSWPGLEYLFLVSLLVVGALIFQRHPVYGLLASSPPLLLMTRLFVFELVMGGEWVMTGVWLLLALTAGAIVWQGSIRTGVLLLVGLHLVTGLAFAVGRSYLPFRFEGMGARQTPELETLINDLAPPTLAAIAILLALLLLHPLRQLAVRSGRRGWRSRLMLLLGMLLTLGSVFALRVRPRWQPSLIIGTSPITAGVIASIGVAVGLVLSLVAAFLLTKDVWSNPQDRFEGLLLPLLSAFAPLVVFALAHPFAPDGQYGDRFQVQVILSYAGVVAWTLLALLVLVWRHGDPARPEIMMEGARG
jgi:hypothetical protein